MVPGSFPLDPPWLRAATNRPALGDDDSADLHGQRSVSCAQGCESYYGVETVFEVHRLFSDSLGDYEPNAGRLETKALMALPLMGRTNAAELLLKPRMDILITFLKRLALRRLKRLPRIEPPPGCIAIDTHVHTCYSPDSLADVRQMLMAAGRRGVAGIAITDHNAFEGTIRARLIAARLIREHRLPETFFVIPGEEVSSSEGHVIGLFLTHPIPPGMTAAQTVDAIHQQGGLAIAAHPELEHSLGELANTLPFDAEETINAAEEMHFAMARSTLRERRAAFYARVTKPRIGASDAHDPETVAACYTLLSCDPTPEAVRQAILEGRTTPEAGFSREDERSMLGGRFSRMVLNLESIGDPTGRPGKPGNRGTISPSIWPYPVLEWSRRF